MAKPLPRDLTSYDLLKTLAVVLMIVDHVGLYFFPGITWLRVLGRLCVPMWFFLIGYARSRDLSWPLWAGAAVLAVGGMIGGLHIFPPSILVTIIAVRLLLDPYMSVAMKGPFRFCAGALALVLLALPTTLILDYGTMALLLAVFGYLCRHDGDDPAKREMVIYPYMIFCIVGYVIMQWALFAFALPQMLALFAGTILVFLGLSRFRPLVLPRLTEALPAPAAALLRLTGRHTLAIYVAHFLFLELLGLWLYPDRFHFMQWDWFAYRLS